MQQHDLEKWCSVYCFIKCLTRQASILINKSKSRKFLFDSIIAISRGTSENRRNVAIEFKCSSLTLSYVIHVNKFLRLLEVPVFWRSKNSWLGGCLRAETEFLEYLWSTWKERCLPASLVKRRCLKCSVLSFCFWLFLSALGTSWFGWSISRIDFRFLLSPLNT